MLSVKKKNTKKRVIFGRRRNADVQARLWTYPWTNIVDQDQMPQNAAPDQRLQRLPLIQQSKTDSTPLGVDNIHFGLETEVN